MPRVFLSCCDLAFCEKLRARFGAEPGFEVCGMEEHGICVVERVRNLHPELVILEMTDCAEREFAAVEAIKHAMPEGFLFLVIDDSRMDAEKVAMEHGADLVFEKGDGWKSLIRNARAVFPRR